MAKWILIFASMAAYAWVSEMDYQDALLAHQATAPSQIHR